MKVRNNRTLIILFQNLKEKEDIADEDEVKQLLQAGLDEDGDTIYTEQGYDGDTECSVAFDWKTGTTGSFTTV